MSLVPGESGESLRFRGAAVMAGCWWFRWGDAREARERTIDPGDDQFSLHGWPPWRRLASRQIPDNGSDKLASAAKRAAAITGGSRRIRCVCEPCS